MPIRDEVKKTLLEIVASALGDEDVADRVDEILADPRLAVVDRDAELPEGAFDYKQHERIFREAGWVKEIKP